jgi:octaprenyl-diphosphate synthase
VEILKFTNLLHGDFKKYLSKIDETLKNELDKYSNSLFHKPLSYALEKGKRIRPLILLLAAESIGNKKEDPLPAAVAIELLHTESIIHDDIIDEEFSRRDKPAFYKEHGYEVSLLTADFVFGMILEIASRYKNYKVSRELSSAALNMCEGEFKELKLFDLKINSLNQNEYLDLISLKTASLFETAAKLGGIIGGGADNQIEALAKYGSLIGLAYQIQDDILDWEKEKEVELLNWVINSTTTIDILKDLVRSYAIRAKKELEILDNSEAKKHLFQLADVTAPSL